MTLGSKRLMGLAAALAVVGGSAAGCGSSGSDSATADNGASTKSSAPIVIGAAIAGGGLLQAYDQPAYAAFKLAVKQANAAGGIDGHQVKLVYSDTRSDRAAGATAAQKVISQGAKLVLVSCDYDYGSPAARAAQQAGVLSFALCAQSPLFGPQGVGNLAFTPTHASLLEGTVMAEWASMTKKAKSAYVIVDTDLAYQGEVCDSFQKRFKALGGTIVGTEQIKNADQSVASTITRIKSANPDVVYYCTFPPGGPSHMRQMRAAGIDQPILSDFAMDGNYWLKAVPNLSDFYYSANASVYGDDPSARVNTFVSDFTKATGGAPTSGYALFGGAILDLYKKAVEQAGTTDSAKVAKALETFNGVDTLVGKTTYTPTVHISLDRPLRIMQIQKGVNGFLEMWQVKQPPTLDLG